MFAWSLYGTPETGRVDAIELSAARMFHQARPAAEDYRRAAALPIVAAMDAAMIFSGRPSRDSAPFEASCILEQKIGKRFVVVREAGRGKTDLSLNSS